MTHKSTEAGPAKRKAVFPGSFNPFTKGHLSVLERALPLFDEVVVAIGVNSQKNDSEKAIIKPRVEKISGLLQSFPNVSVISYEGLTVNMARTQDASYIIRGVRDVADFEYERRMADVNRAISGIETVILFSLPEQSSFSSSSVRELESYGEDVSQFLP